MTLSELKSMQAGFPPFFSCGFVTTDFEHHYVQPIPVDLMAHQKVEKADTNFNGISLEQCAALGRFKNMDSLHKADAIAADFEKSKRLNTEFNEIGENAFIARRLKSNN